MIHASRWLDVNAICFGEALERYRTFLLPQLAYYNSLFLSCRHSNFSRSITWRPPLGICVITASPWRQKFSHAGDVAMPAMPRLIYGSGSFSARGPVESSPRAGSVVSYLLPDLRDLKAMTASWMKIIILLSRHCGVSLGSYIDDTKRDQNLCTMFRW